MKIKKVLCAPGYTGFFFDDQKAIKAGARCDGNAYFGDPQTPGFRSVRQAGESISILLVLEDGQVAHGDCAAVQYSGAGGRDPLFIASDFIPVIERRIAPLLEGREITSFREMAGELDELRNPDGSRIHTALRYGLTQAALDAAAKSRRKLMAQIVAEEYGLAVSDAEIPVFSQSGDERRSGADKMILKEADVLPHALINNIEKIGRDGGALREYVSWLARRIDALKTRHDYSPVIHVDLYGTLGLITGGDAGRMAEYIGDLATLAAPYRLRVEGPVDAGGREAQIAALRELTELIDSRGIPAQIVADEWCNTLEDIRDFADAGAGHMIQIKTPDLGGIQNTAEAVLYCKERGVLAYQGGTCNETDRSAVCCVHVAMAVKPDQILAKPGMGVDEGYMIVKNEMRRILALKDVL